MPFAVNPIARFSVHTLPALVLLACTAPAPPLPPTVSDPRPNVILIVTDDQGCGDFGSQGNPVLRTPNLDALAARSAAVQTFYVSPVCTPTRAALMTGRYCQRTRAIDTYIGRAMMEPAEVTVAEALRAAGWATGIFGKWHLGDCYPMRAIDQGFDEALVLRGGGIGQPSDPEGGEGRYTDPWLFHNGELVRTKGYCTDVCFDAAIAWMRARRAQGQPFFTYLATNAPHGPFADVPAAAYEYYREQDLSPVHLAAGEHDNDLLARIFAMIENVDDNVGKLLAALEAMGAADDTQVLFCVDNGPNTQRYVRGCRGWKSEVYEGGIRSPLWACWPKRLAAGTTADRVAAHVDVMPTILDACGVPLPAGVRIDGRSLLPLLEGRESAWPDRAIVIQAHRGDVAVRYHNFMERTQRWKLLNASGFDKEMDSVTPRFELYDMQNDPFELHDVAAEHPEVVEDLRARYDAWFDDVSSTRPDNYAPPRIVIGAAAAPGVTLTRQDWRRTTNDHGWGARSTGYWEVDVADAGPYQVRVRFPKNAAVREVRLRIGRELHAAAVPRNAAGHTFASVALTPGPGRLVVELDDAKGTLGAHQVHVERL